MSASVRSSIAAALCLAGGAALVSWQWLQTRASSNELERARAYNEEAGRLARLISEKRVIAPTVETTIEDTTSVTRHAQELLAKYADRDADIARVQVNAPAAIEGSVYHRLQGTIEIRSILPPQAAEFMAHWTASDNPWTPTDLQLTRRRDSRGSTQRESLFDIVMAIEAIVLLEREAQE